MQRLIDYFAVVGLKQGFEKSNLNLQARDRSMDIVDISLVHLPEETVPSDYTIIDKSTSGAMANIDQKKFKIFVSAENSQKGVFIIFRRREGSENIPAISNISVTTSKETDDLPNGFTEVISRTHSGKDANLGTAKNPLYLVLRRNFKETNILDGDTAVIQDLFIASGVQSKKPIVNDNQNNGINYIEISPQSRQLLSRGPLFLGYKLVKSQSICDVSLPAAVLDSCPRDKYKDFNLPRAHLPLFTFPEGLKLRRARLQDAPLAKYFSYVMTNELGEKVYVSNIQFYEPLTIEQEDQLVAATTPLESPSKDTATTVTTPPLETMSSSWEEDEGVGVGVLSGMSSHHSSKRSSNEQSFTNTSETSAATAVQTAVRGGYEDRQDTGDSTSHDEDEDEEEVSENTASDSEGKSGDEGIGVFCDVDESADKATNDMIFTTLPSDHDNTDTNNNINIKNGGRQDNYLGNESQELVNEQVKSNRKRYIRENSHSHSSNLLTWAPKVIVLLSHWPFWNSYRSWLIQLYNLFVSASDLPLERWISFFVLQCPLPKHGGPTITFKFHTHMPRIELRLPRLMGLPLFDLSFIPLFRAVPLPMVFHALTTLLLEGKLMISSRRPALVTELCESLRSLLFPFRWEGGYVPRLAEAWEDVLEVPGGLILGVEDTSPFPVGKSPLSTTSPNPSELCIEYLGVKPTLLQRLLQRLPSDVAYIDLDTHSFNYPEDLSLQMALKRGLPNPAAANLESRLISLLQQSDVAVEDDDDILPDESITGSALTYVRTSSPDMNQRSSVPLENDSVRDAMLTFMSEILEGYDTCLLPPSSNWRNDASVWFDFENFLGMPRNKPYGEFLRAFLATQMFSSFIQRRTQSSDPRLVFFDYYQHELLRRRKTKEEPWKAWIRSVQGHSLTPNNSTNAHNIGAGMGQGPVPSNEIRTIESPIIVDLSKTSGPTLLTQLSKSTIGFGINENNRRSRQLQTLISRSESLSPVEWGWNNSHQFCNGDMKIDALEVISHLNLNSSMNSLDKHKTGIPPLARQFSGSTIFSNADREISLPGPGREGISPVAIYCYVQEGILVWPILDPKLFLNSPTHPTNSKCIPTNLKQIEDSRPLVDVLVRDEFQLLSESVQRRLDLESESSQHPQLQHQHSSPSILCSSPAQTSTSTSQENSLHTPSTRRSQSANITSSSTMSASPSLIQSLGIKPDSVDSSTHGLSHTSMSGHGHIQGYFTKPAHWYVKQARMFARDVYGAWFLCLPGILGTALYPEKVMVLAIGVIYKMITNEKVVPDESIFRALLVACSRAGESFSSCAGQIFDLMQCYNIRPNAITYGQFTQAVCAGGIPNSPNKNNRKIHKSKKWIIKTKKGKSSTKRTSPGSAKTPKPLNISDSSEVSHDSPRRYTHSSKSRSIANTTPSNATRSSSLHSLHTNQKKLKHHRNFAGKNSSEDLLKEHTINPITESLSQQLPFFMNHIFQPHMTTTSTTDSTVNDKDNSLNESFHQIVSNEGISLEALFDTYEYCFDPHIETLEGLGRRLYDQQYLQPTGEPLLSTTAVISEPEQDLRRSDSIPSQSSATSVVDRAVRLSWDANKEPSTSTLPDGKVKESLGRRRRTPGSLSQTTFRQFRSQSWSSSAELGHTVVNRVTTVGSEPCSHLFWNLNKKGVCVTTCGILPVYSDEDDNPITTYRCVDLSDPGKVLPHSSATSPSMIIVNWIKSSRVVIMYHDETSTSDKSDDQVLAAWLDHDTGMEGGRAHAQFFPKLCLEWIPYPSSQPTAGSKDDSAFAFMGSKCRSDIPYISPSLLRESMEMALVQYGEDIFQRDFLHKMCPDVFWNLCWYCARLRVPIPLNPPDFSLTQIVDASGRGAIADSFGPLYVVCAKSKTRAEDVARGIYSNMDEIILKIMTSSQDMNCYSSDCDPEIRSTSESETNSISFSPLSSSSSLRGLSNEDFTMFEKKFGTLGNIIAPPPSSSNNTQNNGIFFGVSRFLGSAFGSPLNLTSRKSDTSAADEVIVAPEANTEVIKESKNEKLLVPSTKISKSNRCDADEHSCNGSHSNHSSLKEESVTSSSEKLSSSKCQQQKLEQKSKINQIPKLLECTKMNDEGAALPLNTAPENTDTRQTSLKDIENDCHFAASLQAVNPSEGQVLTKLTIAHEVETKTERDELLRTSKDISELPSKRTEDTVLEAKQDTTAKKHCTWRALLFDNQLNSTMTIPLTTGSSAPQISPKPHSHLGPSVMSDVLNMEIDPATTWSATLQMSFACIK